MEIEHVHFPAYRQPLYRLENFIQLLVREGFPAAGELFTHYTTALVGKYRTVCTFYEEAVIYNAP